MTTSLDNRRLQQVLVTTAWVLALTGTLHAEIGQRLTIYVPPPPWPLPPLPVTDIYQRPGPPLNVKMNHATFQALDPDNIPQWEYAIQVAIQRWNEASSAQPGLFWSGDDTSSLVPVPGEVIVTLAGQSPQESIAESLPTSLDPFGSGQANGGIITFYMWNSNGGFGWTTRTTSEGGRPGGPSGSKANRIVVAIHEMGHVLGLDHSCSDSQNSPIPCNVSCNSSTFSEPVLQVMAESDCNAFNRDWMLSPMAQETALVRQRRYGGATWDLERLKSSTAYQNKPHHLTTNSGVNWSTQYSNSTPDNFNSFSAVGVATQTWDADQGRFGLIYRGWDTDGRVNFVRGWSNSWDFNNRTIWWDGRIGSRIQPTLSSNGGGTFVGAFVEADGSSTSTTDNRWIDFVATTSSSSSGLDRRWPWQSGLAAGVAYGLSTNQERCWVAAYTGGVRPVKSAPSMWVMTAPAASTDT